MFRLLFGVVRRSFYSRRDLLLENLALRQQEPASIAATAVWRQPKTADQVERASASAFAAARPKAVARCPDGSDAGCGRRWSRPLDSARDVWVRFSLD